MPSDIVVRPPCPTPCTPPLAPTRPSCGRWPGGDRWSSTSASWASYRELLINLTRKELTVRYQHSVLGFAWSMLQPVFLLVVYTIVFRILGAGFAKFSIWVLCGLLIWTFVSSSLLTATKSITENYSLVGKVKFPRAVLPLSSVASALVHLGLQSVAFAVLLLIVRHPVDWEYMWLVPFAVVHRDAGRRSRWR